LRRRETVEIACEHVEIEGRGGGRVDFGAEGEFRVGPGG
jgi:hypothetical protein